MKERKSKKEIGARKKDMKVNGLLERRWVCLCGTYALHLICNY